MSYAPPIIVMARGNARGRNLKASGLPVLLAIERELNLLIYQHSGLVRQRAPHGRFFAIFGFEPEIHLFHHAGFVAVKDD